MNLLRQQMEKHTNTVLCIGIKHSMQGRMVSCLKSQLIEYNIWRNATAGMHYACSTMLYGNGSCTASDHDYNILCNHPGPVVVLLCRHVPIELATAWNQPAFLYPTVLTMMYNIHLQDNWCSDCHMMYSFGVRTARVLWHTACHGEKKMTML